MKKFGIIYKIVNLINGKLYAGQTIRALNDRWSDHKRDAKNQVDYPLYSAIRKYGVENFIIEIIDFASSLEELDNKEKFWIKELNSLCQNGNGYNILDGGRRFPININSRPTINLTTGETFSSAKEMAKFYNLSYSATLKALKGQSRLRKGFIFRYKDLNKQREANILESFIPVPVAISKKIVCIDNNEYFDSATSASKKMGILRTSITNNLNGRSKSAGGFCFAYAKSE
jgi:group I intron endonuclease